ncbi:prolipoprotein diacylglyceryl transferase, partial [Candidatus Margulisiibacteriota bacterium]
FIVIYIYVRLNRLDIWKVLDIMSPGVMFGYAIGRVGCFLNGCCYGLETKLSWGVQFPAETILRHPTQLYSAACGLAIFALLMLAFQRRKFAGQVFLFTVLLYTVYRFSLEFFRYSPIRPAGLTLSQYVAIVFFIVGLFLLWKKKNTTL